MTESLPSLYLDHIHRNDVSNGRPPLIRGSHFGLRYISGKATRRFDRLAALYKSLRVNPITTAIF